MIRTGVLTLFSHEGGATKSQSSGKVSPQLRCGGAGGARTRDRQIMSPLL